MVPALLAVGIALTAYGMYQQYQASEAAAAQAKRNAQNARIAAGWAKADAAYEASRLQMRADQMAAHVHTAAASGGVVMGGTAARLPSDIRILSSVDKEMALLRGAQKAAGFIMQGENFDVQSAVQSQQSNAYLAAGFGKMFEQGAAWYEQTNPNQGGGSGLSYVPTAGYGQWSGSGVVPQGPGDFSEGT